MRLVNAVEYLALPRPDAKWLVERTVPCPGIVTLVGSPKSGKTWIALELAYRVARGEHWAGRPASKSKVLYLNLDAPEVQWRERLRALGDQAEGQVLMVHPDDNRRINVLDPSGYGWYATAIETADPALVVVDVLREVHVEQENDSGSMKRVLDSLARGAEGRAVLLVHHTRKLREDDTSQAIDLARGSSYLAGRVDAYWILRGAKLTLISRFDEERKLEVRRSPDGRLTVEPSSRSNDEPDAGIKVRLASLCREYPNEPHVRLCDVAFERWGISRATAYRVWRTALCVHAS